MRLNGSGHKEKAKFKTSLGSVIDRICKKDVYRSQGGKVEPGITPRTVILSLAQW